jgi:hypothetical protein
MKDRVTETDALFVMEDGRRIETKVGFTPMKLTLDHLRIEYRVFQKDNGLKLSPAGKHHKHIDDGTLTAAQRTWLADFSRRWEELATSKS